MPVDENDPGLPPTDARRRNVSQTKGEGASSASGSAESDGLPVVQGEGRGAEGWRLALLAMRSLARMGPANKTALTSFRKAPFRDVFRPDLGPKAASKHDYGPENALPNHENADKGTLCLGCAQASQLA